MIKDTTVTVKIEVHKDGERTNIECFTVPAEVFLCNSKEYQLNMSQCAVRTAKEIQSPTPKTTMA